MGQSPGFLRLLASNLDGDPGAHPLSLGRSGAQSGSRGPFGPTQRQI